MRTIARVECRPEFVETVIPEEMLQGVIYISDEYKCSRHLCLCGCGEDTIMPLGPNGWNYTMKGDKVSFTPSVGNFQFYCKSHYIITDNVANFV